MTSRGPHGEHFGVRGWVVIDLASIVSTANNFGGARRRCENDHRADGDIAMPGRNRSFVQRFSHECVEIAGWKGGYMHATVCRYGGNMAEGVGFEPTELITQRFSRPSHSAALAPLLEVTKLVVWGAAR